MHCFQIPPPPRTQETVAGDPELRAASVFSGKLSRYVCTTKEAKTTAWRHPRPIVPPFHRVVRDVSGGPRSLADQISRDFETDPLKEKTEKKKKCARLYPSVFKVKGKGMVFGGTRGSSSIPKLQ